MGYAMKAAQLIKACKVAAGYPNHRWEVALVYDKAQPNYPFRPENYENWRGDIELLSGHIKNIRQGVYLECWIYGLEELEDNVYIWIDSPTTARVQVCGSTVQTVTI